MNNFLKTNKARLAARPNSPWRCFFRSNDLNNKTNRAKTSNTQTDKQTTPKTQTHTSTHNPHIYQGPNPRY